jgi:tRNA-splicing ligase RtcB
MRVISDHNRPIKIWATDLEQEAEQQLRNLADLPFIYSHVAVMPDAHAGKGSTVGTVIATKGAIIPAAVGVDIGCGMAAIKLPFKIDQIASAEELRKQIDRSVPTGRHSNKQFTAGMSLHWSDLTSKHPPSPYLTDRLVKTAQLSIGTLGGGNHFIEICQDQDQGAWIMLHSGSRNLGKVLAERHIDRAKELMKDYFISLPDPNLAYLVQSSPEFQSYIRDLMFAQEYALRNREEMLGRVLEQVFRYVYKADWVSYLDTYKRSDLFFSVNCHHNYTSIENFGGHNVHITRKGAISARVGQWGIIPGSCGTRSYIVQGRGNNESFCSCSHGAGRKMSRTKAKATFTLADFAEQTKGVAIEQRAELIDEIPGAYKDIDVVMENQKDLVTPVYTLSQILCVKGYD